MQYSKCEKTQNKTLEGHPSATTLVLEWCVHEEQWGVRSRDWRRVSNYDNAQARFFITSHADSRRDSSRVPTPIQERLLKRAKNHVRVAWELFGLNVITPLVGLNRITRDQNAPNIRILLCSFCEEPQTCKPEHEIYTLHIFCSDRTQNFSES